MKKTLIIIILILNSGANLFSQSTKDSLKPKMKMVKEVLYKVENGKLKKRENLFNLNLDTYTIYDKNEKVIETGQYEIDGSLYEKTLYERNENGDVLKAIKKNSLNETKSYWIYEYNSKKKMVSVKTFDSENKVTNIQSNEYDENGNNIEMSLKTSENENGWKYVYKYNSDNKKIEQFRYKPDGSLKDNRKYSYDKNGNLNIEIKIDPNGSILKFVSEYDKMNNITIQNWFNEKEEQTHQTSFEYVYDENGNWITKKRSSNGELSMVWEREIEYYK